MPSPGDAMDTEPTPPHRPSAPSSADVATQSRPDLSARPDTVTRPCSPQPGPSTAAPTNSSAKADPEAGSSATPPESGTFHLTESGFGNRLQTFELRRTPSRAITIPQFFIFIFEYVITVVVNALKEFKNIKVNLFLECEFINIKGMRCVRNFKTKNVPLSLTSDLGQFCSDQFEKILHEKEQCQLAGSGWSFLRIVNFQIRVNKYNPLRGSSHIPLPKSILKTNALINVLNTDNLCFMYAILAKFIQNRPERPSSYTPDIKNRYNWEGLKFPVTLKDIPAFEKKNAISINVYGLDLTNVGLDKKGKPILKNTVFPLKVCDVELADHRDLLYIRTENTSHYVYIKDFDKLVHRQLTKHHDSIHICKKCFAYFDNRPNKLNLSGAERLVEHKRYCNTTNPVRMDLSNEQFLYFKNHEKSQRARFCIYADFESALQPYSNVQPSTEAGYSLKTHLHVPYSYCYLVKDTQNEFNVTRLYRGDNAAQHFMHAIKDDVLHIANVLYANRRMVPVLTPDEEVAFNAATHCYLCGSVGFTPENPKVRDHSHAAPYSYRGAAHRNCNLQFQEQNTVNCYVHNLSNYDAHFIVPELNVDEGDVSVVANTDEKYISFTKRFHYANAKNSCLRLRFLDTFRFMAASLATLANNLPKDLLRETRARFPEQHQFELISRKGVFPYTYVGSVDVLNETQLPSKASFYNDLTLEDISNDDYQHAVNVWNTFGIQDLGQYSDLYLLTDVLLLADVFENFRDMCLREYTLDPAHYLTLPSYSWDAMLKLTGVKLETIQDFDAYLFFEKGLRGGITQCCTRYAQANNKLCEGYDSTKPSQSIIYLDSNNLYGYSMSQSLPTGGFQWLSSEEIDVLDLTNLQPNSNIGYVLEVDLTYPATLHRAHQSLPFCCESGIPPNGTFPKLLTTLNDKKNYIIHYRTLQQAVENGLKISKIHRVLSFNQSAWLKLYIDQNTALRKAARNDFEKDLYKYLNNSIFGKSMQNVRKYIDVRLVCNENRFEKLAAKSTFVDRTYYKPDLALFKMEKTRIVLDKPIYVGMCILELSKWLMYNFHYETMTKRYGSRLNLLYTDTDSLVYCIQSDDLFSEMAQHLDDFDTSEYPKDHSCYSPKNAKTLGKFKDEVKGKQIIEFIGLLAKLYCMVVSKGAVDGVSDKVIKRAKGVTKSVVSKRLSVEDYRNCLRKREKLYTVNTNFVSKQHEVNTVAVYKLSLSPYDDKRYLLPDGIHTLPWGHCDIPPTQ